MLNSGLLQSEKNSNDLITTLRFHYISPEIYQDSCSYKFYTVYDLLERVRKTFKDIIYLYVIFRITSEQPLIN